MLLRLLIYQKGDFDKTEKQKFPNQKMEATEFNSFWKLLRELLTLHITVLCVRAAPSSQILFLSWHSESATHLLNDNGQVNFSIAWCPSS